MQWGLAYSAGAWALLQVFGFAADAFHWPDASKQIAMLALAIGLPIVLTLAWYHGDRGEQRVSGAELVILTVLLSIGAGLLWRYERADTTGRVAPSETASPGKTVSPSTGVASDDRSIAVLPFVNMSSDRQQEFFADGISEELLNLLAQVPKLRVIARTSSFSFKGKEVGIADIARTLNVAHVLEGSVRKSGDTLRITAQLIRASDSSHLWSQTYDRQLTDVFKIQDEIAAAVVRELKVQLLGAAPKVPETDPEAYSLYLKGREIGRQYSAAALQQSADLFHQALAFDPSYAPAWDSLAAVYFAQMDLGLLPIDRGLQLGHDAVRNALEHDPSYAPAYGTFAMFDALIERDYPAASRHVEQGLALDPTNLDILNVASTLARRLGRLRLAIALAEYNVARDPVNLDGYTELGLAYRYNGELDKSVAAYRTMLSLAPESGWSHAAMGDVLLQQGDADAALAEYQKEPIECFRLPGLASAYHALGKQAESDAALADLVAKCAATKPFMVATQLAERGDVDRAFDMLSRADRINDIDLGAVAIYPALAKLHDDPRWLPLLRKLGVAPEQLAAIKFDVALPQ